MTITTGQITNYQIPTAKMYFLDDTATTAGEVFLGNAVQCSVSSTITKKDHFRNYGGQRTKDKTIITQTQSDIKFTLDEITQISLGMFAQGDYTLNTDGTYTITALTRTNFTGILHIVGDNDVGNQVDWIGRVSMSADTGDFFLVQDSDDWNKVPISANIEDDDVYGFGQYTVRESQ